MVKLDTTSDPDHLCFICVTVTYHQIFLCLWLAPGRGWRVSDVFWYRVWFLLFSRCIRQDCHSFRIRHGWPRLQRCRRTSWSLKWNKSKTGWWRWCTGNTSHSYNSCPWLRHAKWRNKKWNNSVKKHSIKWILFSFSILFPFSTSNLIFCWVNVLSPLLNCKTHATLIVVKNKLRNTIIRLFVHHNQYQ